MCNSIYDADSLHPITTEMSLERTETSMHEVRGYTLIMTSPSRRLVNAHFFSLSSHYRRETRLRSSLFGTLSSCASTSISASRKVRFLIKYLELSKKFLNKLFGNLNKNNFRDSRKEIDTRPLVLPVESRSEIYSITTCTWLIREWLHLLALLIVRAIVLHVGFIT